MYSILHFLEVYQTKTRNSNNIALFSKSSICFVMQSKSNDLVEAIVEAIRVGYRHIDCAYGYDNEAHVAEGLKKAFDLRLVKREELFITSKVSLRLTLTLTLQESSVS